MTEVEGMDLFKELKQNLAPERLAFRNRYPIEAILYPSMRLVPQFPAITKEENWESGTSKSPPPHFRQYFIKYFIVVMSEIGLSISCLAINIKNFIFFIDINRLNLISIFDQSRAPYFAANVILKKK